MAHDPHPSELAGRVRRELRHDDGAPERLCSVVTETVPSPVPGELLVCFARAVPERETAGDVLDAAVAVEFAALHQYLHAIPTASGPLAAPAAESPYAEDEVAAIIDSDWLQAAAFARLSASVQPPARSRRCYEALAGGSTHCYELLGREAPAELPPLAPLVATAGRIGGIVGGLDREAAGTVARVAASIGEAIQVPTPTGVAEAGATRSPDWASIADELGGVVERPAAVVDALEAVVEDGYAPGGADG